jgi:hypothetical protein
LCGDGRGFCNLYQQREWFVGQNRISNLCQGLLDVDLGTSEECRSLAEEAMVCCDSRLPEPLLNSCISGVLSGIFENIKDHSPGATPLYLKAELLFVAVFISRITAFLNGRAEVVADNSMRCVLEIIRKAFNDERAWKLAMFYTTAVDMLVWFGTEVDKNKK